MIQYTVLTLPMFVSLFWSFALFADLKREERPRLVMAIFMLFSAILYLGHAVYFSRSYEMYTLMDPLYTFASLSVFPLFYIYVWILTNKSGFKKYHLLHFTPALFFSSVTIVLFSLLTREELNAYIHITVYKEKADFLFSPAARVQMFLYTMARVVFAVQIVIFVCLSWRMISSYDKKIKDFYASTEERTLTWARNMVIAMVIAALFSLLVNSIGKAFFVEDYNFLIIPSLIFSIVLFSIGLLSFKQYYYITHYETDILKERSISSNHNTIEATREKLKKELIILLEEGEIFRKTDLRITDISSELKTNRSYISGIINTEFNSTFSDLINKYRVEYSKNLLLNSRSFILEYISEESGFASINSFLRAFKKITGTTPGNFRKQNKKESLLN